MKENWTKGEWIVECGNDPEDWANYFPKIVADSYTVVGTEGMYGDRETDIANAHLMKAAPKLYEALKRLTKYGDVFAYRSCEESPYEQAMQALASARGEVDNKTDKGE